jgi:hypothetical protein
MKLLMDVRLVHNERGINKSVKKMVAAELMSRPARGVLMYQLKQVSIVESLVVLSLGRVPIK